jgi:hypothetical protein
MSETVDLSSLYKLDKIYHYIKEKGFVADHITMSVELGINTIQLEQLILIQKLIEDQYVLTKDSGPTADGKPVISYQINVALPFEGYVNKYKREKDKIWYETEKARRQYRDYPITKWLSIISIFISVAVLILELIQWLSSQP